MFGRDFLKAGKMFARSGRVTLALIRARKAELCRRMEWIGSERFLNLQQLVPSHFHNPWTMVAFALVAATVLKGIFDYIGTFLVNYAGFGMITDLRDDLYNAILRSSAAFFTKHTTGSLLSTIVNDIEKVQYAMSSVLAEFLQQFFTFLFTVAVVVLL